jgi:hypothetical protein
MSVSNRFEILVKGTYKRFIDQGFVPPVKTKEGILVGNALITQDGLYKNISVNDNIVFKDISLNCVAIKIANSLALNVLARDLKDLYELDKKYNRLYVDSTFFLEGFHRANNKNNLDRAEILWIRYDDAKQRAEELREKIETLSAI